MKELGRFPYTLGFDMLISAKNSECKLSPSGISSRLAELLLSIQERYFRFPKH